MLKTVEMRKKVHPAQGLAACRVVQHKRTESVTRRTNLEHICQECWLTAVAHGNPLTLAPPEEFPMRPTSLCAISSKKKQTRPGTRTLNEMLTKKMRNQTTGLKSSTLSKAVVKKK